LASILPIRPLPQQSAERQDDVWHLVLSDGTQLTTDLLVGADGKGSAVRKFASITAKERAFSQSALVCDLTLERPLDACSVEFHYENGPFTLVPAGHNRANLVWIDNAETLATAKADAETLARALSEKSMRLFGEIKVVSPAVTFPLSTLNVETAGKDGAVLVGDAAHAFPPIGAQGLNLGLRDIEALAKCLAAANPGAYGWAGSVTRGYAMARQADLVTTSTFVDSLFRSLLTDWLPAQAFRSTALWALKTVPSLRRGAIGFGMGPKR
jgi:2-octaprenyl-6-methoxyphenol hydroxylase